MASRLFPKQLSSGCAPPGRPKLPRSLTGWCDTPVGPSLRHIWTWLHNSSSCISLAPPEQQPPSHCLSISYPHRHSALGEINWDHISWWPSPCNGPACLMTEEIPHPNWQPIWNRQLHLLESLVNAERLIRKWALYWGTFLQFRA